MTFKLFNSKDFNFKDNNFPSLHPLNPLSNLNNLQTIPLKTIPINSYSISLIENEKDVYFVNNVVKNNFIELDKRISTISNIKHKFQTFLDIPQPQQTIEIVQFARELFKENSFNIANSAQSIELEKSYVQIILKTFDIYETLQGQSCSNFTSSNLLKSTNLVRLHGNLVYLSLPQNKIENTANKLYHLIFCDDTPIFCSVNNNYYPLGIDDFLNQKFLSSENRELKETYFQSIQFLKEVNDINLLWHERALKHSFTILSEEKSELYFLQIWHQFFNALKKQIPQNLVSCETIQKKYFKLRNNILMIESKYPSFSSFKLHSDLQDIYFLDSIVDIRRKNTFINDFYAQNVASKHISTLKDYPSWLEFHFSQFEKYNKWGLAKHSSIPLEKGTLEVIFHPKYKKDYYYFTLLNLISHSAMNTDLINDYFSRIILTNVEQAIYIINKGSQFLNNTNISKIFFYILEKNFKYINENKNYYLLDNLFSSVQEQGCFKSFLHILFSFKHQNSDILTCLNKNKISQKWITTHYFDVIDILSKENIITSESDVIASFVLNSFIPTSFNDLWEIFFNLKDPKKQNNEGNISLLKVSSPIFHNLSNKYPTETLEKLNDPKVFNISFMDILKTSLSQDFNYACMLLFKKHYEYLIQESSFNSISLKVLNFSKSLALFTEDDILFFYNKFKEHHKLVQIQNFYARGIDLNIWSEEDIISILSHENSYLLTHNKSFLNKLINFDNKVILEKLVYLNISIPDKTLEKDIYNSSDIYIYFLDFINKNVDSPYPQTVLMHYISNFLKSPLININLRKYLKDDLSIENFKTLEKHTIESIIDEFLMKEDVQTSGTRGGGTGRVRKF